MWHLCIAFLARETLLQTLCASLPFCFLLIWLTEQIRVKRDRVVCSSTCEWNEISSHYHVIQFFNIFINNWNEEVQGMFIRFENGTKQYRYLNY